MQKHKRTNEKKMLPLFARPPYSVKPIYVNILNSSLTLVADRKYEIHCLTSGSRPDAIITWWKGKKSLKRIRDYSKNNQTTSILNFVPSIEDNGKTLTCHAENPNVAGMAVESHWNLSVYCKSRDWTRVHNSTILIPISIIDCYLFIRPARNKPPIGLKATAKRHKGGR
jgi:hypothetical protein